MRRVVFAIAFFAMGIASAHTLTGTVFDVDKKPVPGAQIWLTVSRVPSATTSDDAGRFTFADVYTGPVQVIGLKDGYALGGVSGQCIDNINVELRLLPPVSTRMRVINTRYEAIEGASLVRLEVAGVFDVFLQDLIPLGFPSVRSDAEGFLALPPLPKGTFSTVSIAHPGYADGLLPALPAGEDIDFPLPDGVALAGRITDSTGAGVERARVSVFRPREVAGPLLATEVLTDPDGFYSTRVPPGKYFVAAQHPQHAMPLPQPVMADSLSGDAVLNLALPAAHRLHGRAVDANNAPVPLAVFSYRTSNYIVAETVSDASGLFELIVPGGEGALHIHPPRRMSTESPRLYLDIGVPDVNIEAIRFQGLPELHGVVTAREDAPLDQIIITSLNVEPPMVVRANAAGEFTLALDEVPDEPLKFRAEHALRFQRRDFEIDPARLILPEVYLREFKPEPPAANIRWPNNLQPLVGQPAPELACRAWLNLPEGQTEIRLADLHGKVVVLFLWTGFDRTPRSILRLSEMIAAYEIYKDVPDVAIVSVHDAAPTPETLVAYVEALNVPFPVGHDLEKSDTFTAYHTGYVPQTVLIDKKGVLRFYTGEDKLLELVKLLRREN